MQFALLHGFCSAKLGSSRRSVAQAFVITLVIIVFDERFALRFQIGEQEVVLQQDAVLEHLVPALDPGLRLRVERSAPNMPHIFFRQIVSQRACNIAGAVVGRQGAFVQHMGLIAARI